MANVFSMIKMILLSCYYLLIDYFIFRNLIITIIVALNLHLVRF